MRFDDLIEAVGHTPLVRLRLDAAPGVEAYAKLELQNLFAMKDRVARQVILDAGMTELIRPALYGSRHAITALTDGDPVDVGDVVVHGAVCESTDTFGVHQLPELRRGDLVVVHEAGAYAASFSSRYNGRPAAPEVLLWPDGTFQLSERTAPPSRDTKVELTRALDGAAPGPERSHA